MRRLFFSLINLVIAIFFIFIGLFSIFIPWSNAVQMGLIEFILHDALVISLFGFTFLVIAFAMIVDFAIHARRKYYYVKSQNDVVAVDEAIIQNYLSTYWKEMFPAHNVACQLKIKDNHIHIYADLPHQPVDVQPIIIEQVKSDLQKQFRSSLGPEVSFSLSASFAHE